MNFEQVVSFEFWRCCGLHGELSALLFVVLLQQLQLRQWGASTIVVTSTMKSFNDNEEFQQQLHLQQWIVSTVITPSTMKSFDNKLRIRFLYLNFFPLVPKQMILISRSWEGEDVFFDTLNYDLTLWESFL